MFEPLRFLHVADAKLDQPLKDTGPLSAVMQKSAEEASLIAFDQMIEGAISQNVDFVLLAGGTFCEADQSLRARLRLLSGLHLLNEHNIEVFVLPGASDPASAWRGIPDVPQNVSLLTVNEPNESEVADSVAIVREGRVIATLTAGTLVQLANAKPEIPREFKTSSNGEATKPVPGTNGHSPKTPFRVGLLTAWAEHPVCESEEIVQNLSACQCDYLAMTPSDSHAHQIGWRFSAGQTLNTKMGIAHHPGSLQALNAEETGAHGATLIEVNQQGEIRGTFLPFAAAKRLRFLVPIDPQATLEEVTTSMRSLLKEETVQLGEQAWFADWVLQGTGEFFEALQDPFLQEKLLEPLPESPAEQHQIPIHHRLRYQASPVPLGQEEAKGDLERLYQESLESRLAEDPDLLLSLVEELQAEVVRFDHPEGTPRLQPLAAQIQLAHVSALSRSLGQEWFGDPADD